MLGVILIFMIIGPVLVSILVFSRPVLCFEILRPVVVVIHLTELDYRVTFIAMLKIGMIHFSMLLSGLVFGVLFFRTILSVFLFLLLSLVFGLTQLCFMLKRFTQSGRLNFGPISFILLPCRFNFVVINYTRSLT